MTNKSKPRKSTAKQICKQIKTRCPYCNKRLEMSDFAAEFFDRVLLYLKHHDRLVIPNFGIFRMCIYPAREGVGGGMFEGIRYSVPRLRYLRFSPTPKAKEFLRSLPVDDR